MGEPAMHSFLMGTGVLLPPRMQDWLQGLFANSLPLPMVLRVWDVLILEGLPSAVRITTSIVRVAGETLLYKPVEEAQQFFRKTAAYIAREEAAGTFQLHNVVEGFDKVDVPDYVSAYLENAEAFSSWWE